MDTGPELIRLAELLGVAARTARSLGDHADVHDLEIHWIARQIEDLATQLDAIGKSSVHSRNGRSEKL